MMVGTIYQRLNDLARQIDELKRLTSRNPGDGPGLFPDNCPVCGGVKDGPMICGVCLLEAMQLRIKTPRDDYQELPY